jgi:hypothetical protein
MVKVAPGMGGMADSRASASALETRPEVAGLQPDTKMSAEIVRQMVAVRFLIREF